MSQGNQVSARRGLRPEVFAFAWEMEKKLRANDATRGDEWKLMSGDYLFLRACGEWQELERAHAHMLGSEWPIGRAAFVREAADVANFLMMVSFQRGALAIRSVK